MASKGGSLVSMVGWMYDLILLIFSVLVDCFFREVHPRGSWKVPKRGPIILVAAPHANQFVDSLILMRTARRELGRRIAFLIAEKSYKRPMVGLLARATGALPVSRAMDNLKPGVGTVYLPDPVDNPQLLKGIGTDFNAPGYEPHGTISLPTINGTSHSAEIEKIVGPEEIILKKPFTAKDALFQLTGRVDIDSDGHFTTENPGQELSGFKGSKFKVAPHIDQTKVYDAVFETLNHPSGCVGIFPEGGSHDRPNLLPLKAGVALMALGALAVHPDCGVKIIPCGMNYFHAHKFRSRAVIEFGNPIDVPPELVELYKSGQRREAVGKLLDTVFQALVTVTVTSPDYETLMVTQAARRLYNFSSGKHSTGKKIPLPVVVELNRRLAQGYTHYKDDPRIIGLKNEVMAYNKELKFLGIRDHQVEYAKFSTFKVIWALIYRVAKIIVMSIGTLPGLVLFSPVFIAAKLTSIKKSREALAASTVKIQGRDVMATWKLLVALAFAPLLYTFYTVLLTIWACHNRINGYLPKFMPLWAVIPFGVWVFPSVTFAALRIGETGMDILKSLPPLVLCLNPTSANSLVKLRKRRALLSKNVTELINALGPEMYPDFDPTGTRMSTPFNEKPETLSEIMGTEVSPGSPTHLQRNTALARSYTQASLPRNESFPELGRFGFFSTRPPSPSHSRTSSLYSSRPGSRTGEFPIGIQPVPKASGSQFHDNDNPMDEVNRRVHKAMRERGERRQKSEGDDLSWDMASVGDSVSPSTDDSRTGSEVEERKYV